METDKLLKSLEYINHELNRPIFEASISEFHAIHCRNLSELSKLAEYSTSSYLLEKLSEMPDLSIEELTDLRKFQNRFDNLAFLNIIIGPVVYLVDIISGKQKRLKRMLAKLEEIFRINNSIIYLIKNPAMDQLLKQ